MTLKKLRGEVNLFSSTRERFDCFEDKFALFYSIFDRRITVFCTVWMLSAPNALAFEINLEMLGRQLLWESFGKVLKLSLR